MKIRITEPVFFLGSQRKPDDVLDNVQVGPFRTNVIPGGLQRIPQYVEMPEEIKEVIQKAVAQAEILPATIPANKPVPGSFGEATAAVLRPQTAPMPISRTAGILAGLASRRRKLEEMIVHQAIAYADKLTVIENHAPQIFDKANTSLDDRQTHLSDLADSLKDFATSNGGDPL
jgi:hypothetical protein